VGRNRKKDKHLPPRMQMKRGRYYWTPYVDGKLKWRPLGGDYVQAMLQWRDLEGMAEGAASLAQLLERALGLMASQVKPATFKECARACSNLKLGFESFTPADVTPQHIGQYLETRSAKVSANREIAFLSTAWEIARRRGWINLSNPCSGVRRNKERKRKRVATPLEIEALLSQECALADMVELTLMTALRESDMLNITLHALEATGLRVKPRKTDESTEAELLFLWDSDLRAVIDRSKGRRRRVGSLYLFPVTRGKRAGQAYTVNSFQNVWRRYFTAAGVTGLTWHDLRRTALQMREKEEGKDGAQRLAAHASVVTTEGYLQGVGATEVRPVHLNFRRTT
jgi:integrase